jgi:hypothetical protein
MTSEDGDCVSGPPIANLAKHATFVFLTIVANNSGEEEIFPIPDHSEVSKKFTIAEIPVLQYVIDKLKTIFPDGIPFEEFFLRYTNKIPWDAMFVKMK